MTYIRDSSTQSVILNLSQTMYLFLFDTAPPPGDPNLIIINSQSPYNVLQSPTRSSLNPMTLISSPITVLLHPAPNTLAALLFLTLNPSSCLKILALNCLPSSNALPLTHLAHSLISFRGRPSLTI